MHTTVEVKTASRSVVIVSLIGEHDLGDYESLKVAFARAAIRAPNVIVDLSRCEFIDSTVIGFLLHAQSAVARDHGRLVIALPENANAVTRVADLTQLGEVLPIYLSAEAALASFLPVESEAQGI